MNLLQDLDFWLKVAEIAVPGLITLIVPFVTYRWITRKMDEYQARLSKEMADRQADLNKGLEEYSRDISRELEIHKFKLQSVFQTKFYQYQTRSSWLHQKRAEAIEKLFEHLARVQNDLQILDNWEVVSRSGTKEEFYAKTRDDFMNLINFSEEKRIYFDKEVGNKVRAIISAIENLLIGPMSFKNLSNSIPEDNGWQNNKVRKILDEGIHPLMTQLEKMFKDILSAETPFRNSLPEGSTISHNMSKKS